MGPFGRQPAYWVLRERGIPHRLLGPVVGRSTSYVHAVLSGMWAPEPAFISALAEFVGLGEEELFSEELRDGSRRRDDPRVAPGAQTRRARLGRFGRQPAYWVLRDRRVQQAEVARVTGTSVGAVSQVLNGSTVPRPSFIEAVGEFLGLPVAALFNDELIEASRTRDDSLVGPPPSPRVGPYGRQPAYRMLRERRISQDDLGMALACRAGQVSKMLNGFLLPDGRFVDAVVDALGMPATELFTTEVLERLFGAVSVSHPQGHRRGVTVVAEPKTPRLTYQTTRGGREKPPSEALKDVGHPNRGI